MIVSYEIMFFVNGARNNRDEDVCRKWDILAEQNHIYRMSESEYFHYKQDWCISLNKFGKHHEPLRKRSDFNQALSTLNRLHRDAGGQQLKPMYRQWHPPSSSSSSLWQWKRILVVVQRNSKKVKRMHAKVYDRSEQPVGYRYLGKNLRRMAFTSFALFRDR